MRGVAQRLREPFMWREDSGTSARYRRVFRVLRVAWDFTSGGIDQQP
jgi:hypothetical protein